MFDPFVLLYNKSLNDWSLGKQFILFPSNRIEILGKQNELFPSGPVIKCLFNINDKYKNTTGKKKKKRRKSTNSVGANDICHTVRDNTFAQYITNASAIGLENNNATKQK